MRQLSTTLLLLTALAIAVGCASEGPASSEKSSSPIASLEVKTPVEEPVRDEPKPINAESQEEATDIADEQPRTPERIMILARGGPVLLDVWLTVDGLPYDQRMEALVDQVLAAGDTDGDGRSTWSEWRSNDEFLNGELVSLDRNRTRQIRSWVDRYDENDDDTMQRAEAAAWLGRDGGRSATAFTLRSTRSYIASSTTNSRLWQLLDTDADQVLSHDELEAATRRLFLLDTNEDRIVEKAEIATLRDRFDADRAQRMVIADQSSRDAAIHLADRSDAGRLDFSLSDLYAPRQDLQAGCFPARSDLFAALDKDASDLLDSNELEGLLDIDADFNVQIDFSSDGETNAPAVNFSATDAKNDAELQASATGRIMLVVADSSLALSAHDLGTNNSADEAIAKNQIRLMVHDRMDGLFQQLDANADGKLGEREITTAAERLQQGDLNDDSQLAADELPYSLAVAFLRSEPPSERSFYVPTLASSSKQTADASAWFRSADFNSDGDISRREFIGNVVQFADLDANRDGFLSADEAAGNGRR